MSSYGGLRTPLTLHDAERDALDRAQERAVALETARELLARAVVILDQEKMNLAAANADMAQQLVANELAKAQSAPTGRGTVSQAPSR
jgi:hypothetical protein